MRLQRNLRSILFAFVSGILGIASTVASAGAAGIPAAPSPDAVRVLGTGALDTRPSIEVVSSTAGGVRLEFSLPTVALEEVQAEGSTWQTLAIPGGGESGAIGDPMIPTFTRFVLIPDRAGVQVAATVEQEDEYDGIRLLPNQDETGTGFAIHAASYARADFGSAPAAQSGRPALMGGMRVVPLTFQPVRYNPVEGKLRVARRVRVEVTFAGVDLENAGTGAHAIFPSFDRMARDLAVNYRGPEDGSRVESGTWLVICPNDQAVITRLQPLLDWHKRKGTAVRLATTAETGTTADQIKGYIANAYSSWPVPPEFVVLAGDASGTYTIPTFHENISGYYGEGDHPYSLMAGNDLVSDLNVGRLSFNSLTELEVIVAKSVGYESNPFLQDPGWYKRSCLVGDPSHSGQSCIQVMQWIKTRLRQMGYAQIDTIFGGNYPALMTTALNQGDTIFAYRGYYLMSGWNNTYTYGLTNSWKLPFACISTCGTGSFATGTAVSEGFLRAGSVTNPIGAIGAIGTATLDTHTRYNNCFTFGVMQGLLYESQYTMGEAHTRGKLELYLNYNEADPDAVTMFTYWNNLMGDPGVEVWTEFPNPLTVTAPATIAAGQSSLPVTVHDADGHPVEGAQVCAWKGLETYVVAHTDRSGACDLPIASATPGTLLLTASKHNLRSYLASVPVAVQPRFIAYLSSVVDDDNDGASQGNGNGIVNPGESIELWVWLKNSGTQQVSGITAVLGPDDPYVSVGSAVASFGSIAPGGIGTGATPFVLTVDPNCPSGHALQLNLDVQSGSETWHSRIALGVVSSRLVGSAYTLYNAGPNGLFDPGESIEMSIRLRNTGGAPANGAVATLSSLTPGVTVPDPTGVYGNIPQGGFGENTGDHFGVAAASTVVPGTPALFSVTVVDDTGAIDSVFVTVPVGTRATTDPIGPDSYGYLAFDDTDTGYPQAPVYNWVEIDPAYGGAGTEIVLGDNADYQDKSRTVDMPFTFQFYGKPYTRATVCSNGWIAMGDTYLTDYRNWSIPGAGAPNNLLAVFWDDLYQSTGSKAFRYYDAANHRWIVEWSRFKDLGGVTETFEAILYDPAFHPTDTGDGAIVYQYNAVQNVDPTDGQSTVGIQNFDHTVGVLYTYFGLYPAGAAPLLPGRAIRFVPTNGLSAGAIQGFVRNRFSGGSAIEGAEVKLVESGRTFATGPDGRFSGTVPAGSYTVVASREGFAPDTARAVTVAQGANTTVSFLLTDIVPPAISAVTQIGGTNDTAGPYLISAQVDDASRIDTAVLYYRTAGDPWMPVPMTSTGTLFTGSIPGGTPSGVEYDYYVSMRDAAGNAAQSPPDAPAGFYRFYITDPLYAFAGEDPGDPAWSLGLPGDGATAGLWIRDLPVGTWLSGAPVQPDQDHTPDPGVRCFVTGNGTVGGPADEADVDGGCTTLLSPVFDLGAAQRAFLTYWRWVGIADGSTGDGLTVEASGDNGQSWAPLELVTSNQNAWQRVQIDLTGIVPFTSQVVFRFVACDQSPDGIVEAAIDDIAVDTWRPNTTAAPERGPAVFRLGPACPSPFAGSTSIGFSLEEAGPASLAIYDVQGRVVRRLIHGSRSAGPQTAVWDGRDDRGVPAPSGTYFYRLQAGKRTEVRKVLRVE